MIICEILLLAAIVVFVVDLSGFTESWRRPLSDWLRRKTGYTIKKLSGGTKYYVKVRAYKNYTDELGQKVKAYGKWSSAVSKTTKK